MTFVQFVQYTMFVFQAITTLLTPVLVVTLIRVALKHGKKEQRG